MPGWRGRVLEVRFRAPALLLAVVVAALVACGGDDDKVAVSRESYIALISSPGTRAPGFEDAMFGARPKAEVQRLAADLRRTLEGWADALAEVEPPRDAEVGHELLIDALQKRSEELDEFVDQYDPSLTAEQVDTLVASYRRTEGNTLMFDAYGELEEAGFIRRN
jgi:hypothetical protein